MYVGRRHIATVRLTDILAYTCKHCQYTGEAVVTAVGQGQGQSPFFLDNEGAAMRASERAELAGRENLKETIALASCPSCGKRDGSAVRAAMIWGVILGLALAAVCWVVFFVLDLRDHHRPLGVPVRIAASILVLAGVTFVKSRLIRKADKNVAWTGGVRKPPKAKPQPTAPRPVARPMIDVDPYRAPPATAPVTAIATAKAPAPAPIIAADPENKPSMLT